MYVANILTRNSVVQTQTHRHIRTDMALRGKCEEIVRPSWLAIALFDVKYAHICGHMGRMITRCQILCVPCSMC